MNEIINKYVLFRNVIITMILLTLCMYTLFTVDLEISELDDKEFIRCGLAICKRFDKYTHSKVPYVLSAFLLAATMSPMLCYIAGYDLASILVLLFTPIIYIPVFVRGDIISMDDYIMGINTQREHGPARMIIFGITILAMFVGVLEIGGYIYLKHYFMAKKSLLETNFKNN